MRNLKLLLGMLLVLIALSAPAFAITVANLDRVPRLLHIEHIGGQMEHITLQPNQTYRYTGPGIWMAVDNGPSLRAIDNNDYAIWEGGKLRIQKYSKYYRRH